MNDKQHAEELAEALDGLLRVTLDAMRAQGYELTDEEQHANDRARATLAKYRGEA